MCVFGVVLSAPWYFGWKYVWHFQKLNVFQVLEVMDWAIQLRLYRAIGPGSARLEASTFSCTCVWKLLSQLGIYPTHTWTVRLKLSFWITFAIVHETGNVWMKVPVSFKCFFGICICPLPHHWTIVLVPFFRVASFLYCKVLQLHACFFTSKPLSSL